MFLKTIHNWWKKIVFVCFFLGISTGVKKGGHRYSKCCLRAYKCHQKLYKKNQLKFVVRYNPVLRYSIDLYRQTLSSSIYNQEMVRKIVMTKKMLYRKNVRLRARLSCCLLLHIFFLRSHIQQQKIVSLSLINLLFINFAWLFFYAMMFQNQLLYVFKLFSQ